MANNRNRYLMKNTIIFTLGNFGSKLISFFLIPLYTNVLTTTEYGVVDLVVTVVTVAVPVLTLNISESVMRFALDKDADKQKITQIGTGVLLIGMLVGLLVFQYAVLLIRFPNIHYMFIYMLLLRQQVRCICVIYEEKNS